MPRSTVQVAIRTRPTTQFAADQLIIDGNSISVIGHESAEVVSNKQDSWKFKFHNISHNVGQETLYDTLCSHIVSKATAGTNGTIFAYGQTGAGKTFTMIGDTRHYKHRGIAPRAIAQVFQDIGDKPESTFQVTVSYMEIYNERIFDLLAEDEADMSGDFAVVEDRGSSGLGSYVKGLSRVEVDNEEQALNLLFQGEVRRTTAEHLLNKNSNRSHCVFTVYITQRSRLGAAEKILNSKLHLVDLAGSERLKKTMAEEDAAGFKVDDSLKRESMYINKSLTYLEQCVVALTDKNRNHVPYRQTKLTNVLKDSLGGNCATLMIACIWGESRHIEESISTLKLASRMMRVQNRTTTNITMDPAKLVKKYERQIKALKQELMMHDALADRSGVAYDEYTPEQQRELNKELKGYLFCPAEQDEEKMPDIDSVRKVYEVMKQVKIIVRHLQTDAEEKLRNQYTLGPKAGAAGTSSAAGAGDGSGGGDAGGADEGGAVGDLDSGSGGFGLGTAPAHARPSSVSEARSPTRGGTAASSPVRRSEGKEVGFDDEDSKTPSFKSKEEAYRMYIGSEELGKELVERLAASKADFKELRASARGLAKQVNVAKKTIDKLDRALEDKRREGSGVAAVAGIEAAADEMIVDEEEFRLMRELSNAKKSYRSQFQDLRAAKGDLAEASERLDGLKAQLLADFEEWYTEQTGGMPDAVEDTAELEEDEGDVLDDGEAFDKMEMEKIAATDPDSLAYFNANKKMRSSMRSTGGGRRRR